ncbi:hypothetical protein D3C85_1033020 [compost metagenome]
MFLSIGPIAFGQCYITTLRNKIIDDTPRISEALQTWFPSYTRCNYFTISSLKWHHVEVGIVGCFQYDSISKSLLHITDSYPGHIEQRSTEAFLRERFEV